MWELIFTSVNLFIILMPILHFFLTGTVFYILLQQALQCHMPDSCHKGPNAANRYTKLIFESHAEPMCYYKNCSGKILKKVVTLELSHDLLFSNLISLLYRSITVN